jgi:uncharacterized protein YxeA
MKKIICQCIGLLMLIGCSTKLFKTSNEKMDMNHNLHMLNEDSGYRHRHILWDSRSQE